MPWSQLITVYTQWSIMDHTPCKTQVLSAAQPLQITTLDLLPLYCVRKQVHSQQKIFLVPDNHVDFFANIVSCEQFHECLVLENPTWCGHVSSGTDQKVIDLWYNLGWYDSAIEIKISYQCTFVHYSVFFMPILNVWTYLSANPLVAGCLGAAVVCKIPFLFTNL